MSKQNLVRKLVFFLALIFVISGSGMLSHIIMADAGNYSITGSYTLDGFTVNLSGTASGNPYVGNLNQQNVSVDCGTNGDNEPNNWVTATSFTVSSSGGSGGDKLFNASWAHSCSYTVSGSYYIYARVHHAQPEGNEGSEIATYSATIIISECTPDDTQSCLTGQSGICSAGTQTCSSEGTWGTCVRDNEPVAEICDNQIDDDCDGYVDAADTDCQECTPDDTQSCSTGQSGICSAGTQTCRSEGAWGMCVPDNEPVAEICDNQIDDDCDGYVDGDDSDCIIEPYCGDNNINREEDCDNGSQNGQACTPACGSTCQYCSSECTLVTLQGGACSVVMGGGISSVGPTHYCGDGKVDFDEECDDGNVQNGDGCSSQCKIEGMVLGETTEAEEQVLAPAPQVAGEAITQVPVSATIGSLLAGFIWLAKGIFSHALFGTIIFYSLLEAYQTEKKRKE